MELQERNDGAMYGGLGGDQLRNALVNSYNSAMQSQMHAW